jgi:seryl-tRNA synthetase
MKRLFSKGGQNQNGSVTVPEALRPYLGGLTTIG